MGGGTIDIQAVTARTRRRLDQTTVVRDPVAWTTQVLGEHLWSKQAQIAQAVGALTPRIAVPSCHSAGKSHMASRVVAWWVAAHPPAETMVVTTAPTYAQVRTILWRYIRQAHRQAALAGTIVGSPMETWTLDGDLVAFGRKPGGAHGVADPEAMATFQGIHARHLLVILDEACGIPRWLWDAVETLATAPGNVVLAIGNPDDPESRFAEVCEPGSGWHTIRIPAHTTPNFTDEHVPDRVAEVLVSQDWVDRAAQTWGRSSALYRAKVLAEFAAGTDDQVIPAAWVARCRYLDADDIAALNPRGNLPEGGVLGVDWARSEAGDKATIVQRHRGVIKVLRQWNEPDTTILADHVSKVLTAGGPDWTAVVDASGGGGPLVDILRRRGHPVHEFKGSGRPKRPDRFLNTRAEAYWEMRDLTKRGGVALPSARPGDDTADQLAADLGAPRWHANNPKRLIQVERKDEIIARLGRSPDLGDAAIMACWAPPIRASPDAGRSLRRTSRRLTAGLLDQPM